jgi:hypothetical protein
MKNSETHFGGVCYKHSDFNTVAKRKNLPEEVKKAILGKDYVEPVEEPTEPINESEIV